MLGSMERLSGRGRLLDGSPYEVVSTPERQGRKGTDRWQRERGRGSLIVGDGQVD